MNANSFIRLAMALGVGWGLFLVLQDATISKNAVQTGMLIYLTGLICLGFMER